MENKEKLMEFLNSHKLMTLSTRSEVNGLWIANVYYAVDNEFNFYFMSEPGTQHCKDIDENGEVAVGFGYFNPENLSDRAGVQIQGTGYRIKNFIEMGKAFKIYTTKYMSSGGVFTIDNIRHKVIKARPYIIKPKLIKFMNDKLYGNLGTEVFRF